MSVRSMRRYTPSPSNNLIYNLIYTSYFSEMMFHQNPSNLIPNLILTSNFSDEREKHEEIYSFPIKQLDL